jgi:ankyrin repeat protein
MKSLLSLVLLVRVAAAGDPRLVEAAQRGDLADVQGLLRHGADVNSASPDGATALHWAAELDQIQLAKALISGGANPSAANRYGVTPLSLAATNGSAAMIDLLLQAKADPNTVMGEGETVLMTAARAGRLEAVQTLLKHGANVNAKESWRGQTALMWAAAEGHTSVVEALIAAGGEINARSGAGFSAFLFAIRQGHAPVVRRLLKAGVSVNDRIEAATQRPPRPAGPSPDATGTSALDIAVANAHFELAAMLLDAGADPNAAAQGWTPLHTVTWIRKPGAGSNDPAPQGSGSMGSLTIVRKLIERGANVNAQMTRRKNVGLTSLNTLGATPFMLAARTGDAELMRLLAENGANALLPNADNTAPLMVAAGVGTRSPGEDAGTEPEVLEAVKLAFELGGDVNATDRNGETAIHGVAYKHLPSVAQYLLDHGAKVDVWNRKNKNGWTPLRIAVGVHRGMNLRSSPETAAVLMKVMKAAGVSTVVDPEPVISGATK